MPTAVAEKPVLSKTAIKAAVKSYSSGTPLVRVAADLHVAVATARDLLVDNGAVIRGRGRPRKVAVKA